MLMCWDEFSSYILLAMSGKWPCNWPPPTLTDPAGRLEDMSSHSHRNFSVLQYAKFLGR